MSERVDGLLLMLHLTAGIAWIGPALGAWWLFLERQLWRRRRARAWDENDDWLLGAFLKVLKFEHLAFFILMVSGIARLDSLGLGDGGALGAAAPLWLKLKIWVVMLVVMPFEAYDVWLAHWVLPARLAARREQPEAFERALKRHDQVVWAGSVVLGLAIPTILYCVTVRPV